MKIQSGVAAGIGNDHTIKRASASIHEIEETQHLVRNNDDYYMATQRVLA